MEVIKRKNKKKKENKGKKTKNQMLMQKGGKRKGIKYLRLMYKTKLQKDDECESE